MMWTFISGTWYPDDGVTPPPPAGAPAAPANFERYDDAPPVVVPAHVAPFAPGWDGAGNYTLTHAQQASYSIRIDSHQKKHITSWPGNYHGKPGTKFPVVSGKPNLTWSNQDVINYALALLPNYAALATTPLNAVIQNNVRFAVAHQPPGKQAVNSVIVNTASWDPVQRYWEFHFYPG